MGIKKILMWVVIVLVIGFFVVGIIMRIVATNKCEDICKEKGTIIFDIIPNGQWNINDACLCYFPDKYEMFIIK